MHEACPPSAQEQDSLPPSRSGIRPWAPSFGSSRPETDGVQQSKVRGAAGISHRRKGREMGDGERALLLFQSLESKIEKR